MYYERLKKKNRKSVLTPEWNFYIIFIDLSLIKAEASDKLKE
jgi:hypothetical protein